MSRWCRLLLAFGASAALPAVGRSQLPRQVIDMHIHAIRGDWSSALTPFNVTTGRPSAATTGAQLEQLTIAALDQHHVRLAVLSGGRGLSR